MGSLTHIYMTRVKLKQHNMGRKRKNQLNTHGTTPSQAIFFGDIEAPKTKPATQSK